MADKQVKFLKDFAGYSTGDVATVSETEAKFHIENGAAKAVEPTKKATPKKEAE